MLTWNAIVCAQASTVGGLPVGNKTPDEVLASKADSARLSDKQRGAIVALRRRYLRNLGVLSRRRQALTLLLQVLRRPLAHELRLPIIFASLQCVFVSLSNCNNFKQSINQWGRDCVVVLAYFESSGCLRWALVPGLHRVRSLHKAFLCCNADEERPFR